LTLLHGQLLLKKQPSGDFAEIKHFVQKLFVSSLNECSAACKIALVCKAFAYADGTCQMGGLPDSRFANPGAGNGITVYSEGEMSL